MTRYTTRSQRKSMSDTSETAVRRLRQDSPTVDAVCRQIERHVDPSEGELAVDFAEIFFSKAPPELLRERSTDALTHMALGAFRFLQSGGTGQVGVSVLNPDVDNEGWYAPVTVLRTNVTERPFIVDTIREFLHAQDLAVEHLVYPVMHVDRDAEGRLAGVGPSHLGGTRESLVHCEVVQVTDPKALSFIEREVRGSLSDVLRATDDFTPMIDAVNEVVAELAEHSKVLEDHREEVDEIQAFLRWLRDGAFVFLGYRSYDIVDGDEGPSVVVEPDSGLGVLSDESDSSFRHPVPLADLERDMRSLVESGPTLIISKTNAESTVHRRVRMDYIGVKKLDDGGQVVGEHRFLGLFTSKAFSEDAEDIPILREKLAWVLEQSGVREGSHDYKEIITIFNSLPKEELFLASAEEIGPDIRTILTSYNTAGRPGRAAGGPAAPGRVGDDHPAQGAFLGRRAPAPRAGSRGALRGRSPQLPPGSRRWRPGTAAFPRAGREGAAHAGRAGAGREAGEPDHPHLGRPRAGGPGTGPPTGGSTTPGTAVRRRDERGVPGRHGFHGRGGGHPGPGGHAGRRTPDLDRARQPGSVGGRVGRLGGDRAEGLPAGRATRPVRFHADPGERRAARDRGEPVRGYGRTPGARDDLRLRGPGW